MCCCSTNENHVSKCGCGSVVGAELWSRKKKIRVLEHYLECLEKKRKEVTVLIQEHKDEMK